MFSVSTFCVVLSSKMCNVVRNKNIVKIVLFVRIINVSKFLADLLLFRGTQGCRPQQKLSAIVN